jgi:peptide/nickel transport system permease protein
MAEPEPSRPPEAVRPLQADGEPAAPGQGAQEPADQLIGPDADDGQKPAAATPTGGAVPTKSPRASLGLGGWLAIGWMVLILLLALVAPLLPFLPDPNTGRGNPARAPMFTDGHFFGTDGNGRDVLSRTIYGTRVSMLIGVTAVAFGFIIGGALGMYAGYFKNPLASFITWLFDVLLAFPALVLALSLVAILASGDDVTITHRNMVLILALGIVSIPLLGRITRANTMTWSQREFVTAARSLGAKDLRILFREVLPNVLPAMFSIALLGIAVTIVAEGGLAVIGVGSQSISWGNLIADGRLTLQQLPHVVFIPSAAIFFTVLALNYLGDVVRSRFDVRESML